MVIANLSSIDLQPTSLAAHHRHLWRMVGLESVFRLISCAGFGIKSWLSTNLRHSAKPPQINSFKRKAN